MTALDPMLGKLVVGRYRLLERLGKGGMGSVYKATQLSMDRPVAIKLIHPSLAGDAAIAARFHREMQATSRVEHPNTVQVFDYGQAEDGQLFLVMELLQGPTLAQVLQAEGWLPAPRLSAIAAQVVRALGAAHAQGIVHRDLKPENVMLVERFGERDFVKVLDFGIARFLALEASASRMTADGALIGTPSYMSPEQARGEEVGPKSDLYALGVVLYQASVGLPPFEGATLPEILMRHLKQPPRPPSEVVPGRLPPALEQLILALLEKDPVRRPADAEAVLGRLLGAPPIALQEAPAELQRTSLRPAAAASPTPGGSVPWARATPAGAERDLEHPSLRGSPSPAPSERPAGQRTTKPPPERPPAPAPTSPAPREVAPLPVEPAPPLDPAALPAPAPQAEASAAPPPPRRRAAWKAPALVFAAALILGLLAVSWRARAAREAARAHLDALLASEEDPPAPAACRARERPALEALARPAELLAGAGVESRRPQDAEALQLLDAQAGALAAEAEYWALTARARLSTGAPPGQVRAAAERATALCPGYALAHKLQGNALQREGRAPEAKAAYERALAEDSGYLAPRSNLGLIALLAQDPSAAAAAFDLVLARKPTDARALRGRAEARLLAGQTDAALADLEAAAQASPQSPDAPLRQGQVLEKLGRRAEAQKAYCRARALGSEAAARPCEAP